MSDSPESRSPQPPRRQIVIDAHGLEDDVLQAISMLQRAHEFDVDDSTVDTRRDLRNAARELAARLVDCRTPHP